VTVPGVLTSGHHEAVRKWRLKESLRRTLNRRPELLSARPLTKEEARLLSEVRDEFAAAGAQSAAGAEGGAPSEPHKAG
jgi:tRNA (guanine37-N1)-methyltransferase